MKEEKDMSWGNNNGNGQGYGGEDVYGRLDQTRPVGGARFPYIEDGKHRLAVVTLEEYNSRKSGPSVRALFEVEESARHKAGTYVTKMWAVTKPPAFPNGITGADEFADFCRKLKGAPEGHPIGADIRRLIKERGAEQLARGMVIDVFGLTNAKGNWVNLTWTNVPQTQDQIAAKRARIELKGVPATGDSPAPQPQMQQGYGPTPQQQVQGAPNPTYYPDAAAPAPLLAPLPLKTGW